MRRYCPAGHGLNRTLRSWRQHQMGTQATFICDGCSRPITTEYIAGCCSECNIDFCERCFASGQPIEEMMSQNSSRSSSAPIQACCMLAIAQVSDPLTAAARGERYNGRRPSYARTGRVSYSDYPDPSDFGWTFTGSCENGRAEFFEKDFAEFGVVKLDFYYTTGTVKTVLDHPRQGVTQLFAKGDDLTPDMYRKILRNPREHTSVRYHKKQRR